LTGKAVKRVAKAGLTVLKAKKAKKNQNLSKNPLRVVFKGFSNFLRAVQSFFNARGQKKIRKDHFPLPLFPLAMLSCL